jgi:outer membrane lipase/esterase
MMILACLVEAPVSAQDFSSIYVFGGSYSDAGAYLVGGDSRRWTINPAPVWNQLLGDRYGISVTPNEFIDSTAPYAVTPADGTNYGQGGARVSALPGEFPANNRSVTDQLNAYLASTGGVADPNALYSLEGGGNDIFYWNQKVIGDLDTFHFIEAAQDVLDARADLQTAASDFANLAITLADAGAGRILVLNIHDIAVTPVMNTYPQLVQDLVTDEVTKFNDRFTAALAASGRHNFILVDIYHYMQELVANGAAYGFTNTTQAACLPTTNPAIDCTTSTPLATADAASTYLFSDLVHPSGPGHLAFSQYIESLIDAPYLVGLTAEVPIIEGRTIFRVLDSRTRDKCDPPGWSTFAEAEGSFLQIGGDAPAAGLDGAAGGTLAGLEYGGSRGIDFGAILAASHGSHAFSSNRGGFDSSTWTGTSYATAHFGSAFAQLSGTAGHLEYPTIDRHFDIYMGGRTNSGSTDGTYYAARLAGGSGFDFGSATLTPFGALSYQQASVRGYTEGQGDSSSMTFGDQQLDVLYGTIGGRLATDLQVRGLTVHPELAVAFNRDFLDQRRTILAGIADPGDVLFATTLPAPEQSWWTVDAQATFDLRPGVTTRLSAGGQSGQSGVTQLWGRIALNVRM